MTVRQFITQLQQLPQDVPVVLTAGEVIRLRAKQPNPDWSQDEPAGWLIETSGDHTLLHLVEKGGDADRAYSTRMRAKALGRVSLAKETP
jgi:hypothetical protein